MRRGSTRYGEDREDTGRIRAPGSRIRRWFGLLIVLVAGPVFLAGCASGPRAPAGPVVSPTGIVYEPGVPPEDTRYSQTATLFLRQDRLDRALEQAEEGIEVDPGNPVHYFLAGSALARLGEYRRADSMFVVAEEIYPAYELQVEPERESAWAVAFNEGVEAYNEGDTEVAERAWRNATVIFSIRPEAHRNLATLLAGEGEYGEAIEVYQDALAGLDTLPATRVLEPEERENREDIRRQMERDLGQLLLYQERFAEAEPIYRRLAARDTTDVRLRSELARVLDGMGRTEEATAIYTSLLSEQALESTQLFNLGVALFRSSNYDQAGEAFQRLTTLHPRSRDAWFNYANALFAARDWSRLVSVGDRLLEVDPLGENGALIVARAHLELGDEEAALRYVAASDSLPIHVGQLQLSTVGTETLVQGQARGNVAEPGTLVRLRFVFFGDSGRIGSRTVTVDAPEPDQDLSFEVRMEGRAGWYRYELVEQDRDDDGGPDAGDVTSDRSS
ncbi:MAG: tetratricopeptide repeat protein, partial [Longimicrobiales bacterium]|nr:tetratricopeptide repeat protein [Longimicrobiales bacterium]